MIFEFGIFLSFIEKSIQLFASPDRADILWALGRHLCCPQIKARAGIALIEKACSVASNYTWALILNDWGSFFCVNLQTVGFLCQH
jgi:hypothetical protein